jgi:crotonobetainyl-CoA:carnitine CoA-transferase CaiB-like acyl-CoA transferase
MPACAAGVDFWNMQSLPPLNGVRVLDMTQFLSGPFSTQILADLGAEVIKVEAPQGDLARHIPPHFVDKDSVYYLSINRGKSSIVADMKMPEGIDLVRKLVLASDIVIENFRPGVLDRLGLGAAKLREEKPGLIWCSISGFGQNGPYRDKPAYDMIVQALSGGMSLTGEVDGHSVRAGIPIGDLAAGMYAAIAVLAALHRREETGRGEYVDIAMLDCQAAMLCYQGAYYLHSGKVPGRQGRGHDSIATYRAFTAKDGVDVVVTANTERMWTGLCKVLGRPELPDDPRFIIGQLRYDNRNQLWPILESAFLQRTADDWLPLLEKEEIPVAVVNTLDRVMADPQIKARDMIMDLAAEDGRKVRVMGNPIKFAESASGAPLYPPAPGENSAAILSGILELTDAEISSLTDRKVIVAGKISK